MRPSTVLKIIKKEYNQLDPRNLPGLSKYLDRPWKRELKEGLCKAPDQRTGEKQQIAAAVAKAVADCGRGAKQSVIQRAAENHLNKSLGELEFMDAYVQAVNCRKPIAYNDCGEDFSYQGAFL